MTFIDYVEITGGVVFLGFVFFVCLTLGWFNKD